MIDVHQPSLPPKRADVVKYPVMVQRWTDVVFLHWRYDVNEVQRLLPPGVFVDEYDASAWVGLVPFRMEGLGVPGLAPLPLVGAFPEVNVRTYVRAGTRRGVWFFSLDVDRLLPALVARGVYHLPYCAGSGGHLRVDNDVSTRVERQWPRRLRRPTTAVAVRIGSPVDPHDPLVRFLTCRWGLVSATRRGRLRYARVDHPTWPLLEADVLFIDDHLVTAAGLSAPIGEPHALFSPGVDVRVGRPVRLAIPRGRGGEPAHDVWVLGDRLDRDSSPRAATSALGSFCSSDPTHDPSHTTPAPYVVVSARDYPYVPTIARSGFK